MPGTSINRRPYPKGTRKRLEDEEIEKIIENIDSNSSHYYDLGIKVLREFIETVNEGEFYYENISPQELKWKNEIIWRAIQYTIEAVLKETKGAYEKLNMQSKELENTMSMCMAEDFRIEKTPEKTIVIWNDKNAHKIRSFDLPKDWSIRRYKFQGITKGMAKLSSTIGQKKHVEIPYPAYLKLKKIEAIPIEDLNAILKAKEVKRKANVNEKEVWGEIVAEEEMKVSKIVKNTGLSKETIYKYLRELFVKEDLVLTKGAILKVHPSVIELTEI